MNVAFRRTPWISCVAAALVGGAAAQAPVVGSERIFLSSPAPVGSMELSGDALLSPPMQPRFASGHAELTLGPAFAANVMRAKGRCNAAARVVVSGKAGWAITDCINQRYDVALPARLDDFSDLTASQLFSDGEIAYAYTQPRQAKADVVTIEELQTASHQLGGHVILEPGEYTGKHIVLDSGTAGETPLVVDGGGKVTLSGGTTIMVARANVTLTGFRWKDESAIDVSAKGFHLSRSQFEGCGRREAPQSHCLLIRAAAADAEISFNTFAGSQSMSIKIRAGAEGEPQPVNAYVHHNQFHDIERLSGNGQEAIQIAGPGGGESQVNIPTRIEHNLFVRANGDVEVISVKAPGVSVRWNSFVDLDAAPNLRGASNAVIEGNVLIRTRTIRIAGKGHRVVGNIILCPKGPGIMLLQGSRGYRAAVNNQISGNLIVARKQSIIAKEMERPVVSLASGNEITGNVIAGTASATGLDIGKAGVNRLAANSIRSFPACR